MPSATAAVHVDAPPHVCFDYLAEPANHPDIVPGLTRIDAEMRPDGGHRGSFTYELVGVPLDLAFDDVALEPPRRRVYEVTGPMEGRATYLLDPEDGGTRFTFENSYEIPGPEVLGSLAGPVVRRYLRKEAEATVENAKREIEASHRRAAEPETGGGS